MYNHAPWSMVNTHLYTCTGKGGCTCNVHAVTHTCTCTHVHSATVLYTSILHVHVYTHTCICSYIYCQWQCRQLYLCYTFVLILTSVCSVRSSSSTTGACPFQLAMQRAVSPSCTVHNHMYTCHSGIPHDIHLGLVMYGVCHIHILILVAATFLVHACTCMYLSLHGDMCLSLCQ